MLNLTTLPASDNLALFHVARSKDEDDRFTSMLEAYHKKAQNYANLGRMIVYTENVVKRIYCGHESEDSLALSKLRDDALEHLNFLSAGKDSSILYSENLCALLINYATSLQMSLVDNTTNVEVLQEENKQLKNKLQAAIKQADKLFDVINTLDDVADDVDSAMSYIETANDSLNGIDKDEIEEARVFFDDLNNSDELND